MPDPTLLVELVAFSLSFFLPFSSLDEHLVFSHIFLSYFFSYQWRCDVQRIKNSYRRVEMPDFHTSYKYQFLIPDTCLWYMLWISVFIPVLNFWYEFLSLISVTNTRISIRKKNSGRGKVGLREVKKTEKKRSEEEMEVGEAVRAELLFPLSTKVTWCGADCKVRHI